MQCTFQYSKWPVLLQEADINLNEYPEKNSLNKDIGNRLKWLMFCRLIFSVLVISGIYFFYVGNNISLQIVGLYIFSAIITAVSLFYAFAFRFVKNKVFFSVFQVVVDTFLVTFLIWFTGIRNSVFEFFYLVVILYSSSVLFGGRPFWVAVVVSMEYAALLGLSYLGKPDFLWFAYQIKDPVSSSSLIFDLGMFIIASFAVAWLASLLSTQVRRAREELENMDVYVKKMEGLAHAGEIAAGFAHEVKNPMASLRGAIQLMISDMEKGRTKDVEKLLKIVLRESDRLDELVNNFLYFARPVKGSEKKVEPCFEIKEILKFLPKDKRFGNNIEVKTKFDYKGYIKIDPEHFRQIMWNILINAMEATLGGGEIFISVKEKNKRVEIRVHDSGHGIDHEIMDKIYDPFFSTKKNGSGLGLSIVARLVKEYEGSLYISSPVNQKGVNVFIGFKLP